MQFNNRDYKQAWIDPIGKDYRMDFYNRSQFDDEDAAADNPSVLQLVSDIVFHTAGSVLEIGCGFGRLTEAVADHFGNVWGCDVSPDMLELCPKESEVSYFNWDVCKSIGTSSKFIGTQSVEWDILFCRGVMMYFTSEQLKIVMLNMITVARKKILIYEWQYVCDAMKEINDSEIFEFHPILQKAE